MPRVLCPDCSPAVAEVPAASAWNTVQCGFPRPGAEGVALVTSVDERLSVTPDRVLRLGQGDALGVTGVPGVLGALHLLEGAFAVERWQGRTSVHDFLQNDPERSGVSKSSTEAPESAHG